MSRIEIDGSYLLYRTGAAVLTRLPRIVVRALMSSAAMAKYASSSSMRATVAANLDRVLGGRADPVVMRGYVRRSFLSYARYWSDISLLDRLTNENIEGYFAARNLGDLDARFRGGGAVVALPHLGSWEIGAVWAKLQGYRLHTVVEPASSPRLTEWFAAQRQSYGLCLHPLGKESLAPLLRALDDDEIVVLVADRDVVGDGLVVDFFGEPVRMPGGPAVLALRSGKPLVPCAIYHDRNDLHLPVLLDPIDTERRGRLRDDVQRVTQDLAHAFERLIRAAPEQWHVFQPHWLSDLGRSMRAQGQ